VAEKQVVFVVVIWFDIGIRYSVGTRYYIGNNTIIGKVLKGTMERVIWNRSFCEPGTKGTIH